MGFHVNKAGFNTRPTEQRKTNNIYAPKRYAGGNAFSDVDCIRYSRITDISEIVFDSEVRVFFQQGSDSHFPGTVLFYGRSA